MSARSSWLPGALLQWGPGLDPNLVIRKLNSVLQWSLLEIHN